VGIKVIAQTSQCRFVLCEGFRMPAPASSRHANVRAGIRNPSHKAKV